VVLALSVSQTSHAADAISSTVKGKVSEVTLYRGQARIVRTVEVVGDPGGREIAVTGLPAQILPASLYAEASEGIEVRAVRHRVRAVGEEPREEVRELLDKEQELNDQLALNAQRLELAGKQIEYIDSLQGFVAPTAKVEVSKGVLDAKALEAITRFSFEQRSTAMEKQVELKKTEREIKAQIALVTRQREEITRVGAKAVHEAVLFLEKRGAQPEAVRISYMVSGCGWEPSYNFRADSATGKVRVEYYAMISQMSGEDWDGVNLTLSTASPALSAAGPGLAPFRVALGGRAQPGQKGQKGQAKQEIVSQLRSITARQQSAQFQNSVAVDLRSNIASAWGINDAANDLQLLELTCAPSALDTLRTELPDAGEGPSISYRFDGKHSLTSRSDQQMVRILQVEFETRFYYVATPVLSSYVFREAELKNTSEEDLLAGPVSVYLDRRFVGRSEIPSVARGQTFVVGFGADPQLRASREIVDRGIEVQGGNSVLSVDLRLAIESYKDVKVPVRLQDRIPHTDSTADVRLTLSEMKDPLREDAVYLRLERPKGILRWELDVGPHASGEKARIVNFGYRLEYDRNLMLTTPASGGIQRQQEFQELQMKRNRF